MRMRICVKCGIRFRRAPERREQRFCRVCRRSEKFKCPGCSMSLSFSSLHGHAILCESEISPEEIRAVVQDTQECEKILKKNGWTLNKPIEQLNEEYYNNDIRNS